ncbi:MAG: imidazolonepropionase [Bacteroidota bacterium]
MASYTLVGPVRQLLPLADLPPRGAIADEQLTLIEEAGLLLVNDRIEAVGPYQKLLDRYGNSSLTRWRPEGDAVLLPGFIDCHTHICFAGSRARDFALRNAGSSYLEIAKAGGGIWDTVQATRATSEVHLTELTRERALRHLRAGVTTIEVKSGYGLSLEAELKQLRAIKHARSADGPDLIATCLAAHVKPRDFTGTHEQYLERLLEFVLPQVGAQRRSSKVGMGAQRRSSTFGIKTSSGGFDPREVPGARTRDVTEGLAQRVDIFIEEEAFTPGLSQAYLLQAKAMGFELTVHADQFHPGGSQVAVAVGALSADHLEASTDQEVALLAKSNTVAVALPGASLGLGVAFTPARRLLDAGAVLAIATDWNPGSGPMGDLITQASILATYEKLSTAEVLAGITYRAAAALGLTDRGRLLPGQLADFCLFPTNDYREILYQQGQLRPSAVWRNGRCLHQIAP